MSDLKPIIAYVHEGGGPNPYKVIIALEELSLPYDKVPVPDPKAEWFTSEINPNGRIPAIRDPNNGGLVLWESGAIVEYLVDTYDRDRKLTVRDDEGGGADKWRLKQFLHFQMSGQGPYYGQSIWFHKNDPANAVAKERYNEQIVRVIGVLDGLLKGKEYLVGDKFTYADLVFIPWNRVIGYMPFLKEGLWEKYDIANKYPNYMAWNERLNERESVKKAYA